MGLIDVLGRMEDREQKFTLIENVYSQRIKSVKDIPVIDNNFDDFNIVTLVFNYRIIDERELMLK
jgi:hypothetical protein